MQLRISVIICSHNPSPSNLSRTLDALKLQTIPLDEWELILVDNSSKIPLSTTYSLEWHPNARHVVEETLGLTPARIRGIHETKSDLLLFVDDDNILSPDYLENAIAFSSSHPFLGAWGGTCKGEFQISPPENITPYLGNLAIRTVTRNTWSNKTFDYEATPVGAGMCIRKTVADEYLSQIQKRTKGIILDRRGDSLMSCGDHDIAYCACDLGLGVGVTPSLELLHIIPSQRLNEAYILKLLEADAYSTAILRHLRSAPRIPADGRMVKVLKRTLRFLFSADRFSIAAKKARENGFLRAYKDLGC